MAFQKHGYFFNTLYEWDCSSEVKSFTYFTERDLITALIGYSTLDIHLYSRQRFPYFLSQHTKCHILSVITYIKYFIAH